jgi:hypothetical protein
MRTRARHAERKLKTLEQQYEEKKRNFTQERDDAIDRLKRAKV